MLLLEYSKKERNSSEGQRFKIMFEKNIKWISNNPSQYNININTIFVFHTG
jgi:hypothetical protein